MATFSVTPFMSLADETALAQQWVQMIQLFNQPKSTFRIHHQADPAKVVSMSLQVGQHVVAADGPLLRITTVKPQPKFPKLRYYSAIRASNVYSVSGQGSIA